MYIYSKYRYIYTYKVNIYTLTVCVCIYIYIYIWKYRFGLPCLSIFLITVNVKESRRCNVPVLINHYRDLEKMLSNVVRSPMDV